MGTRTRNWACIVYPESAKEEWQEYLEELGCGIAISPLHDKDKNKDGTIKKAHYHVIIAFDSVKSYEQVHKIVKSIPSKEGKEASTIPQEIQSIKGAVRYLIHLDNKNKVQYNQEEIRCLGGFDVSRYIQNSEDKDKEEESKIKEVLAYIKYLEHERFKRTINFYELIMCAAEERIDLIREIRKYAYFYNQIIKS